MNIPRQPFVGLALIATFGIVVADFVPVPKSHWVICAIGMVLFGFVLFWKPNAILTYAFVSCGFFLLHNFRTGDTFGMKLAEELSERPRTVRATGSVSSEPKAAPNGFATFLFSLESIELEGRTEPTNATLLVRWHGNPEFGDELKLFGIAEPIAAPPWKTAARRKARDRLRQRSSRSSIAQLLQVPASTLPNEQVGGLIVHKLNCLNVG